MNLKNWTFEPIAIVQSPYHEKFGIPRQPGLAANARGILKFQNTEELRMALRDLEGFSHVWVIFVFHAAFEDGQKWKPRVRPPRLGGKQKVGVLSSRSPHRPNPIGLSVLKIEEIRVTAKGGPEIEVSGVDLLDGTPVLDIKPYLAYCDSVPEASEGWAATPIERFEVVLEEGPQKMLSELEASEPVRFKDYTRMVTQTLEIDPRPAFQKRRLPVGTPEAEEGRFGFDLLGYDIHWRIKGRQFIVTHVVPLSGGK